MHSIRHRFVAPKMWLWLALLSSAFVVCGWAVWMLAPVTTSRESITEDPDITGLMMQPVFSVKDQCTGDSWRIKAQHAYHQDNRHYSLSQPQCHWKGDHGMITLTSRCGYWNQHLKQGSLWHHVCLRHHHKGCITTQQVHWDRQQRVWSNQLTQGYYRALRFQSQGFVLCASKLTLKGPARLHIDDTSLKKSISHQPKP